MTTLLLELFKGTGSFSKVFKEYGYTVISLDIEPKFNPTICCNLLDWDYKALNIIPDVITASVPCNSFSCAGACHHLRDYKTMKPLKPIAFIGDMLLFKTLEIIDYYKTINPNLKWVIENPRGTIQRMMCLKDKVYVLTHYYLYGSELFKPTIFFNNFGLILRNRKDYPNLKHTKLVKNVSLLERYKIPELLIEDIVKQIDYKLLKEINMEIKEILLKA